MRTSVDLPDALMRDAKIAAIQRGVTFRELLSQALEKELRDPAPLAPCRHRTEFPIIPSSGHGTLRITESDIRQAELEEDLKRGGIAH